jgi:hypothetical protein
MPPASGCWWRCCCCTATSRTLTLSPTSPSGIGRVVSADVVAVEARKAAQQRGVQPPPVEATPRLQQVVSLTERRLAELPSDDRPLPSVDAYDDLLG